MTAPDARMAIRATLTAVMAWLSLALLLPGDTLTGSEPTTCGRCSGS